jgi:hypothetical protein
MQQIYAQSQYLLLNLVYELDFIVAFFPFLGCVVHGLVFLLFLEFLYNLLYLLNSNLLSPCQLIC